MSLQLLLLGSKEKVLFLILLSMNLHFSFAGCILKVALIESVINKLQGSKSGFSQLFMLCLAALFHMCCGIGLCIVAWGKQTIYLFIWFIHISMPLSVHRVPAVYVILSKLLSFYWFSSVRCWCIILSIVIVLFSNLFFFHR